jgi:hypothetical protein
MAENHTAALLTAWKRIISEDNTPEQFIFQEATLCKDRKHQYELTWKKVGESKDAVTHIKLNVLFDYPSFEAVWKRVNPDIPVTEHWTAWTIGRFFVPIGHQLLMFGSTQYEAFAKWMLQKKGSYAAHEFGF